MALGHDWLLVYFRNGLLGTFRAVQLRFRLHFFYAAPPKDRDESGLATPSEGPAALYSSGRCSSVGFLPLRNNPVLRTYTPYLHMNLISPEDMTILSPGGHSENLENTLGHSIASLCFWISSYNASTS